MASYIHVHVQYTLVNRNRYLISDTPSNTHPFHSSIHPHTHIPLSKPDAGPMQYIIPI